VVNDRGGQQAGSRHDESPELEADGLKAGGGHRLCNLARRDLPGTKALPFSVEGAIPVLMGVEHHY
jgi:hypothetical protein